MLDLRPGVPLAALARRLGESRGTLSFSNFLRKAGGLSPVAIALVHEIGGREASALPALALAELVAAARGYRGIIEAVCGYSTTRTHV